MSNWYKFFLILFIYLAEITGRQRGSQREGNGSRFPAEKRAHCGTQSQEPMTKKTNKKPKHPGRSAIPAWRRGDCSDRSLAGISAQACAGEAGSWLWAQSGSQQTEPRVQPAFRTDDLFAASLLADTRSGSQARRLPSAGAGNAHSMPGLCPAPQPGPRPGPQEEAGRAGAEKGLC